MYKDVVLYCIDHHILTVANSFCVSPFANLACCKALLNSIVTFSSIRYHNVLNHFCLLFYSRRNSSVSLSSFAVSLEADFCLFVAAATETDTNTD